MFPILFKLPVVDFPIQSFGVMVALAALLGFHILPRLAGKYGDDPEGDPARFERVSLWVLIGVIAGARVLYVLVEVARGSDTGRSYLENPAKVLFVWEGGLVMYGGMFGGMVAGLWCARRQGLRLPNALDLGLAVAFLSQSIGRVGCLLVGDDYGSLVPEKYAHLPFPITLSVPAELRDGSLFGPENAGRVIWATQPWMSINALLIAIFAFWLLRRRRYAGQVSLWVILIYALTRSFIEAFRGDSIRGKWLADSVSTSQLISLISGLVAVILIVRFRRRRDPELASSGAAAKAASGRKA